MSMKKAYNKGEWSELYAFIRLIKEGRIYAADEAVNKIDDVYFPILKIIREEIRDNVLSYEPGESVKIYQNDKLIDEVTIDFIEESANALFKKIFEGGSSKGAFTIPEIDEFLKKMKVTKIKAPSLEKVDMTMQIHDINTGFSPIVGFSVKSDVGSPPTLINAAKNTRIKYKVKGLTDQDIEEINAIDKIHSREYIKARMSLLFNRATKIEFDCIKDETFEDNLVMLDSLLPSVFGELVLLHYKLIEKAAYDCELLVDILSGLNPLKYRRKNVYRYKFKKMITAAALGMTAGKEWDGYETATGGYIIIKKNGDVLCFHLYNRDYFEEYLMKNTQFDRPSASKCDYGYLYKENEECYIDLNVQIRFKSINNANNYSAEDWESKASSVREHARIMYGKSSIEVE